jgi:hypothetical protein
MKTYESDEQQALFQWATYNEVKHPELKLLHAIPNGGKRYKTTAIRLKNEGVRAGVPDLSLPVARHGKHGLYIEMKATHGKLSENQKQWKEALDNQGYIVMVCWGWEAAKDALLWYLEG